MTRVAAVCLLTAGLIHAQSASPFIEKPYLQLGDNPRLTKPESLALLWHSEDEREDWAVEVRDGEGAAWRKMASPVFRMIDARTIAKHFVWRVTLNGLAPGQEFQYRVLKD